MTRLNDQEFAAAKGQFVSTVKDMWKQATVLSVAAIGHYYDSADMSRIASLYETFAEAKGSDLLKAYEQAVYAMTDVKFRQSDDLTQPVKCVKKGKPVTDWSVQLDALEKNGLQAKVKKLKTKAKATLLNNDGQKVGKTENGGIGLDQGSEDVLTNLSDEQKAAVAAAQEQLNEYVKSLAAGDKAEPPKFEGAGITPPEGLGQEERATLTKLMDDFAMLRLKAPEKFARMTKSVGHDLGQALSAAEKAAVKAMATKPKAA